MRASLVGAYALVLAGCSSLGHWGSSDDSGGTPYTPPAYDGGTSRITRAGAPDFGDTRRFSGAPALSGGTIATTTVSRSWSTKRYVIAADPDRDAIYVAEIDARTVRTIPLADGDEPGRVTTDGAGTAFVALRRGGALVTIDVEKGLIVRRQDVCAAPRGVAYDPSASAVHVACAGGELVTIPAEGGAPTRTLSLDLDLRDVVVGEFGDVHVSRFRSAEVLTVSAAGTVRTRVRPGDTVAPLMNAAIAWRMVPGAAGQSPLVIHQLASRTIDNHAIGGGEVPPYYSGGGPCAGFSGPAPAPAVAAQLTWLGDPDDGVVFRGATLPVDVAVNPSGDAFAIVAAAKGHTHDGASLQIHYTAGVTRSSSGSTRCTSTPVRTLGGQITSVVFVDDRTVVAFVREPAALVVAPIAYGKEPVRIAIPDAPSREDTGHAIFHSDTGAGVACASCHAEGGDDGLVWSFTAQGRRRTPSLKGTLSGTAPYHWSGELAGVAALVRQVYQQGMSGPEISDDKRDALQGWLFAIPAPAAITSADPIAAVRGRVLFAGSAGCSACHAGPQLTNNATVDVGTGGRLQVPSLVGVAHRAPFLHAGCAETLADRFGSCGGGDKHGNTSALAPGDVSDLVAYLSTL